MKNTPQPSNKAAISVSNAKGGVGKTTISINLAYELAFRGYKVAAIDLDNQLDLTKTLSPTSSIGPTIIDLLQKKCKVSAALLPISNNLSLIPGSQDISKFTFKGSEQALQRIVEVLKQKFDFIIIDHPPALHEIATAGYIASDYVLVVSEAEPFSVGNLNQLMKELGDIKAAFQPKLKILGIVMNKIDMRRNLTKSTLSNCRKVFGNNVFGNMISTDTSIPNALHRCVPLRKLQWYSRSIGQFSDVATEMIARM